MGTAAHAAQPERTAANLLDLSLDAGFDHYLVKPIELERVQQILRGS